MRLANVETRSHVCPKEYIYKGATAIWMLITRALRKRITRESFCLRLRIFSYNSLSGIFAVFDMASNSTFLQDVKARRTIYAIAHESTITDSRIEEIVKHAVLHVPSAFNSQSARALVLLHEQHEKLWDIAYEAAKATAPPEMFQKIYEPRVAGFRGGYGTVQ